MADYESWYAAARDMYAPVEAAAIALNSADPGNGSRIIPYTQWMAEFKDLDPSEFTTGAWSALLGPIALAIEISDETQSIATFVGRGRCLVREANVVLAESGNATIDVPSEIDDRLDNAAGKQAAHDTGIAAMGTGVGLVVVAGVVLYFVGRR